MHCDPDAPDEAYACAAVHDTHGDAVAPLHGMSEIYRRTQNRELYPDECLA